MKTAGQTAGILLVDDTPDNLRLLSDLLEGEGYEVRPASSGARLGSGSGRTAGFNFA